MEAHTRRLKSLFQHGVQYEIPAFQRPYVWTQEDQWEPLWEDIRNAAERYTEELDALDEGLPNRIAQAEEKAGSHFLGAVVLQQLPRPADEISGWSIIDGQQRMTTLQLFLNATHLSLSEVGFSPEGERVRRLVLNDHTEGDQRLKVYPADVDRDAFRGVILGLDEALQDSQIEAAHEFFATQVKEWIIAAPSETTQSIRAHALETALLGLLELVVIDLSTQDDPFTIFETLNARGTPLIASDLIKNFVLQTADRLGIEQSDVYEDQWSRMEDKWWRKEVRQGRLRRPRIDVFLNYWLIAELAEDVPSHQVFTKFRRYVEGSEGKVVDIVRDVVRSADQFKTWDDIDPYSRVGTFLYRWRILDAGVVTPLLIHLFDRLSTDEEELLRSLDVLESYLVRRMVTRMTTKNYNAIVLELLSRIKSSTDSPSVSMAAYLGSQEADSRLWPTDAMVSQAFGTLPLYRMLTRGRLRMVLEVLEDSLRGPKTEAEFVSRGRLTIEHVMPQQWRAHWPPVDLESEEEEDLEARRDRQLHSIGNLTLVTKSLNPALSNSAWEVKKEGLYEHGVLLINSDLIKRYGDGEFLEAQMWERAQRLADLACQTWKGA
jgi:hypothetical protein